MLKIHGLGHINIIVDDIDAATTYYQDLLGATPEQLFPHLKNEGFAKSAGFMDNPNEVDVSISFLKVDGANFYIELMEYHAPQGDKKVHRRQTHDIGGPRHICLQVNNIDECFEFLKTQDVTFISEHPEYKPYQISSISPEQFRFYDPEKESDQDAKQNVCGIIGQIRYFYFVDKYGIQWECEQGHTDISNH